MMTNKQNKPLFFVYAPPLKGARKSLRKAPQAADPKSERWKWSVFYYWWEYLRRHEGYRQTCKSKGKGKYAKLYRDFEDIHSTDFWSWWTKHDHLFAEPSAREAKLIETDGLKGQKENDVIYLRIPRENTLKLTMKQVKQIVKPKLFKNIRKKVFTQAQYKVASKPFLSMLDMYLKVWDARRDNPEATLEQLADITKVTYNNKVNGESLAALKKLGLADRDIRKVIKRRKELVVKRYLRIAEQYINNAADLGTFPFRTRR